MDFIANNLQIVGLDLTKGAITLGKIKATKIGFKLLNKSTFKVMPMCAPYALLNLGLKAEITIKNNVVTNVKTLEENTHLTTKSQKKAYGVSGLIVDSVNAITHIVKFEHPLYNPIKVLCMCTPKVQKYVLPLSGLQCVAYLSTDSHNIPDKYKTIIGLTPYEE